jgi:hypothetical protein
MEPAVDAFRWAVASERESPAQAELGQGTLESKWNSDWAGHSPKDSSVFALFEPDPLGSYPVHWPSAMEIIEKMVGERGFDVDLRFGKLRRGPKHHFLPHFLLALDFWQKHFVPVLGTVCVAGPQLRSPTVSLPVEPQQG